MFSYSVTSCLTPKATVFVTSLFEMFARAYSVCYSSCTELQKCSQWKYTYKNYFSHRKEEGSIEILAALAQRMFRSGHFAKIHRIRLMCRHYSSSLKFTPQGAKNTDNIKITKSTLAGVAQWIERQPANQRVTGSIPSQGTCLGCRPGPWWGVYEKQPHTDVSLPPLLLPFLSKTN